MPVKAIILCMVLAASLIAVRQGSASKTARETLTASPEIEFTIDSPHQRLPTTIRVLFPDGFQPDRSYRVVYVLPVEAAKENRYGDGLNEIRKYGLQNRWNVICVAPTFSDLPWYANHPNDPRLGQERYFLNDVLPTMEANFPVLPERRGRLLLGFSKSGWGAFSLLLRNPETFERAVAWDAPLTMTAPGQFGSGPIFGTPENFQKYEILSLLERSSALAEDPPRLFLSGWCNFGMHHARTHQRMLELGIPHGNRDEKQTPHDWHSGWVPRSFDWLCRDPE